ncbi:peptidase C14 [Mesorhizobium sp. NZP2077]|nr:peptidase C14 [Mesorhizobium sp. NZP2077]QKD19901.1 tetratricopeptide repeat protein [Mesorhizobium sp. NZP2077]
MAEDDYRMVRPLANPIHDGEAMEAALKKLGFEVVLETNRDLRRMRRALDDFRDDAKGADVALVYFSGHGVEISGDNRLLPVDADASSLDQLDKTSLPLEEVRAAVAATAKVGLIVLDACRSDPFSASSGDGRGVTALTKDVADKVKPGLGRVGRAENILFAFSAAPGETAADGTGENSPFTTALTKYLGTDGLEIRSVLTLVQQEVYDLSRGKQLPYVESGLPKLFFAAAAKEQLPERERLLLAMADVTPEMRGEVEQIASDADMPLAPLYGALLSKDLGSLGPEQRSAKLREAADAFVKVQREMTTLASGDPEVTQLRQEAERQLSLGAFDAARAKLAEAAGIDKDSRQRLKANYVERTLSEAATHSLEGGAASALLRYQLAADGYEKATALYREVNGEDIPADDRLQQLITLARLGDVYTTLGRLDEAAKAYKEWNERSTKRAGIDPTNVVWQRDVSLSLDKMGDTAVAQGKLGDGLADYQASADIAEKVAAAAPAELEWQSDLSFSYDRIGYVMRSQGNLKDAMPYYQKALEISKRVAGLEPDNIVWQRRLGVAHDTIGDVLIIEGDYSRALDAFSSGFAIWRKLTELDPTNLTWQRDLCVSYTKIGDSLQILGEYKEAIVSYQAGLAVSSALASADPENLEGQRDLAILHDSIGDAQLNLQANAEALAAFNEANHIWETLVATDQSNTRWLRDLEINYSKLGDAHLANGEPEAALSAYKSALNASLALTGNDASNSLWQRDLAINCGKIGDLLARSGNKDLAAQFFQQSLDISARFSAIDPDNSMWLRDMIIDHFKMAEMGLDVRSNLTTALKIASDMQQAGILSPTDAWIPDELRRRLKLLDAPAK